MEAVTKLKDVSPCPWNTRGEIKPETVKELAESITSQGLINPITIWKDGDGQWICIAGNRRLAAMRQVFDAETEIEGLCTEFHGTEDEAKLVTVTENLQRIDVGPIDEAALVKACMDDGMTSDEIAAKTGRSVSWVERRKKLLALDEAWAKRTDLTADCLERISAYPADVQKKVARSAGTWCVAWKDLKKYFERETMDLGAAKFDTAKSCFSCLKRTGVEADLFGDVDGVLGRCMDCTCFKAKAREAVLEKVAKLTKGASEVAEVSGKYEMPRDTSPKKTKAMPCAYWYASYNGEIIVKWGESAAALADKERREKDEREAERAREAAEDKRRREILDKVHDFFNDADNSEAIRVELRKLITADEDVLDYVLDLLENELCGWHSGSGWAEILDTFDFSAKRAGVSDEDKAYLIAMYKETK